MFFLPLYIIHRPKCQTLSQVLKSNAVPASKSLLAGSANFLYKGPSGKYFKLCWPHTVSMPDTHLSEISIDNM